MFWIPSAHTLCTVSVVFLSLSCIACGLSALISFFSLRQVIGIDHLTSEVIPRLDSSITAVFVRVFLFHGTQKIPESDKTTKAIPVVRQPRTVHA